MSEVIIVGAGLAGLTAAITCARAGHQVRVLEKNKCVGSDEHHPSVDCTPIQPEYLGKLLGIDFGAPQIQPHDTLYWIAYGKKHVVDASCMALHLVERGSRPTSLENQLFQIAQDAGVRFDFGWQMRSQRDLAELPPGSIIATGLHREAYDVLDIPYQELYGSVANGAYDGPSISAAWFDSFAGDYCYFASTNGLGFALAFDRKPLSKPAQERFIHHLYEDLGVELPGWHTFEGVAGTKRLDNPRLFSGKHILAGTLAGMQDPFFFFGVHSSLISGYIAALAVDDKATALDALHRLTSIYKYTFVARRLFDPIPHRIRKPMLQGFGKSLLNYPKQSGGVITRLIPGYRDIDRKYGRQGFEC